MIFLRPESAASYANGYSMPNNKNFYIHTQLNPEIGLWRRFRAVLRYLFKPHSCCRFGGWSETIIDTDKAKELRNVLAEFIRDAEAESTKD